MVLLEACHHANLDYLSKKSHLSIGDPLIGYIMPYNVPVPVCAGSTSTGVVENVLFTATTPLGI